MKDREKGGDEKDVDVIRWILWRWIVWVLILFIQSLSLWFFIGFPISSIMKQWRKEKRREEREGWWMHERISIKHNPAMFYILSRRKAIKCSHVSGIDVQNVKPSLNSEKNRRFKGWESCWCHASAIGRENGSEKYAARESSACVIRNVLFWLLTLKMIF